MEKSNAIVITHGMLGNNYGKTAHGLLRQSSRFEVKAIIDQKHVGEDAGEVMDGKALGINVYGSVSDYFNNNDEKIDHIVVGLATHGGLMTDLIKMELKDAMIQGCSVVNGLHDYVSDMPDMVAVAEEHDVSITDIRKPKKVRDLHFWSGEIYDVDATVIAVLGIDCALGKRTTAGFLYNECNAAGIKTDMIYTGQTGWMQGYKHGFIFDSTLNDFISGEIERAVVNSYKDGQPELILLEGQSSLRNPSGPAGSEFIVSGNAKGVILQVAPERIYFDGYEEQKLLLPSTRDEIRLINQYGGEVIAVTVANSKLSRAELRNVMILMEKELEIPVVAPLIDGVGELVRPIREYMQRHQDSRAQNR